MRIARLSLIRLPLALVLAVTVSALAEAHSGVTGHGNNHVKRARHGGHPRPDSHHVTAKPPAPTVSWTTPKAGGRVSGQLDEHAHNCTVSARSTVGIDHVSFYRDGTLLNTQRYVPYSCVWNTATVADRGSHTLRAVVHDNRGNTASASVRVTVDNAPRPDTTAPQTMITAGPLSRSSSGSASFSFNSSEAGSSYQCGLDSGSWTACSSAKAYSGLADGAHSFEVKATDAAGNTDATPARRSFTVDKTPPETTITDGPSGTINSSSAGFNFGSSEASSSFECRLDAGSWASCSSPKVYSGLVDGAHSFEVRANDTAGNLDPTPAGGAFVVADTNPPQTTITDGPSGTINSSSASFKFGSSETGSSFECSLDNGAWGSCTSPKAYTSLSDGTHTVSVRATDTANNTDPSPDTRSVTVDTTLPETSIDSFRINADNSITFAFSSDPPDAQVLCRIDSWSATTDCSGGSNPRTTSPLPAGDRTLTVWAVVNGAADPAPAVQTFTIDNSPPPATRSGAVCPRAPFPTQFCSGCGNALPEVCGRERSRDRGLQPARLRPGRPAGPDLAEGPDWLRQDARAVPHHRERERRLYGGGFRQSRRGLREQRGAGR